MYGGVGDKSRKDIFLKELMCLYFKNHYIYPYNIQQNVNIPVSRYILLLYFGKTEKNVSEF